MAIPKRVIDWIPIREAFLTAPERPTWNELEAAFGIEAGKIRTTASDEGWVVIRAKRISTLLDRTAAGEKVLAAALNQKIITDKFCGVALVTVEALEEVLADLGNDPDKPGKKLAASTRSGILNTVSFALLNVANALKNSGVVGLPRALMNELEEKMPKGEEGRDYMKAALSQISITINNARDGKALDSVDIITRKPYPKRGVHHPLSEEPRAADVL